MLNALILGSVFVCLFAIPLNYANAETAAQREARLQAELAQVETEQRETEAILNKHKNESASIERDVAILNARIKAAQLSVRAKNLEIERLSKDITQKTQKISTLEERMSRGQRALADILEETYKIDNNSVIKILLSGKTLTDSYKDLDYFESIQASLANVLADIRDTKTETELEKSSLTTRKNAEEDARAVIQSEQRKIESLEAEKKALLTISKNNEQQYGAVLAEKRLKAAQIRAALFALRDTEAIPFEKAYEYAKEASRATGVRPAFILAVLTQESALGKNVGSCHLTDPKTGAGVSIRSGNVFKNVMKPDRDVAPFLVITKDLGMDPYKTLVSCPQSIGWGGAMGPAQFIPSTWNIFKDKIAKTLGVAQANPWEPRHAFFASAMYLADLGAVNGNFTAERNAACRYYSGRACDPLSINSTYGNQVMSLVYNIQTNMVDPLEE